LPTHVLHQLLEAQVFGTIREDVNLWADQPADWFGPKNHRQFRHSVMEGAFQYRNDPEGFAHYLLHTQFADPFFSAHPELHFAMEVYAHSEEGKKIIRAARAKQKANGPRSLRNPPPNSKRRVYTRGRVV